MCTYQHFIVVYHLNFLSNKQNPKPYHLSVQFYSDIQSTPHHPTRNHAVRATAWCSIRLIYVEEVIQHAWQGVGPSYPILHNLQNPNLTSILIILVIFIFKAFKDGTMSIFFLDIGLGGCLSISNKNMGRDSIR